MKINIVDSIMGSGKTQAAINYMNNSNDDEKFLYVTPYLTEVDRIIKSCPSKNFRQPEKYGTKIRGIKDLLNKGYNIVTTHTLFHLFDDEIIDLCYSQGYILIMDEVTDVIDTYYIGETDLQLLLDNFVTVDKETGLLKWREDQKDYGSSPLDTKFLQEKHLCEMNCLAMYGKNVMLWMFPIKIFNAFRESYILTYMFNSQMQKYYYDERKDGYYHQENSVQSYGKKVNIKDKDVYMYVQKDTSYEKGIFANSAVLILGCVFLSGNLVFIAIADIIVKPITRLTNATKELSKGNYNVRVNYVGDDEISKLNQGFNQMAQQLAKQEETRQKFISDISHEFQTPLTAIQGFANILKDEDLPKSQRQKYADIILFHSKRLSTLSKNMLQFCCNNSSLYLQMFEGGDQYDHHSDFVRDASEVPHGYSSRW